MQLITRRVESNSTLCTDDLSTPTITSPVLNPKNAKFKSKSDAEYLGLQANLWNRGLV